MLLDGKVVVVAGGAGLLGKAFTSGIVRHGATAIVADASEERGVAVCNELRAATPAARVEYVRLDITNADSIVAAIESIASRHGRIDALVNTAYPRNARYGRHVEDVTYEDFSENVSVHLGGYFHTTKHFGKYFRERGAGNIVSLGSIYGVVAPRFEIYEGTPMTTPVEYAAIKSGVIHLTRYFARYYRSAGVRVNCISPGGIKDRQPESFVARYSQHAANGDLLQPNDVVGTLVFLLSDLSAAITGQNLVVDAGWTL
jgi:NAD(P)-dependent dehydrogenase (short-subunit alcohol dehydrogenase family)